MIKNQSEMMFEYEVIDYLTTIGGVKQWEYKKEIKNTEQLCDNFNRVSRKFPKSNKVSNLGN